MYLGNSNSLGIVSMWIFSINANHQCPENGPSVRANAPRIFLGAIFISIIFLDINQPTQILLSS